MTPIQRMVSYLEEIVRRKLGPLPVTNASESNRKADTNNRETLESKGFGSAVRRPMECLLMFAFGGKVDMTLCGNPLLRSLLGVHRTCPFALHMSAFDPKRT